MTSSQPSLAVLKYPHWRVTYRPHEYREELIPTLAACFELVEATKLSLRGWDFPHVGRKEEQLLRARNWVGSQTEFSTHIEYWRLYQSGQFLHLHAVREA